MDEISVYYCTFNILPGRNKRLEMQQISYDSIKTVLSCIYYENRIFLEFLYLQKCSIYQEKRIFMPRKKLKYFEKNT